MLDELWTKHQEEEKENTRLCHNRVFPCSSLQDGYTTELDSHDVYYRILELSKNDSPLELFSPTIFIAKCVYHQV